MKRALLAFLILVSPLALLAVALMVFWPYVQGRNNARVINVSSNVIDPLQRPLKPIIIQSQKEMLEQMNDARVRLRDHDAVRDEYGLADSEKVMQGVDFASECLILIPFWQPADDNAGLNTPYLASRKLLCHVWIRPKQRLQAARHPARGLKCIVVVVRRDSVDEVEVRIDDGQANVFAIK